MSTNPASALWDSLPFDLSPCDGCDDCGSRCIEGWECSREEFLALLDYLTVHPEVKDLCRRPRTLAWEGGEVRRCWFRDSPRGRCAVYPVRPLVCRLFGHVEWLPCPTGRIRPAPGAGVALLREYAKSPRATFAQWAVQPEFVSRVRTLLGADFVDSFM